MQCFCYYSFKNTSSCRTSPATYSFMTVECYFCDLVWQNSSLAVVVPHYEQPASVEGKPLKRDRHYILFFSSESLFRIRHKLLESHSSTDELRQCTSLFSAPLSDTSHPHFFRLLSSSHLLQSFFNLVCCFGKPILSFFFILKCFHWALTFAQIVLYSNFLCLLI